MHLLENEKTSNNQFNSYVEFLITNFSLDFSFIITSVVNESMEMVDVPWDALTVNPGVHHCPTPLTLQPVWFQVTVSTRSFFSNYVQLLSLWQKRRTRLLTEQTEAADV